MIWLIFPGFDAKGETKPSILHELSKPEICSRDEGLMCKLGPLMKEFQLHVLINSQSSFSADLIYN